MTTIALTKVEAILIRLLNAEIEIEEAGREIEQEVNRKWRGRIEKGKISKRNLKDGNDEYWNKGVKYYNKALSDLLEREEEE